MNWNAFLRDPGDKPDLLWDFLPVSDNFLALIGVLGSFFFKVSSWAEDISRTSLAKSRVISAGEISLDVFLEGIYGGSKFSKGALGSTNA